MAPGDGRKAGDIGVVAARAFGCDLTQGFLHVDRVPMGDGVEGEPQGAELLFLALPQRAFHLAAFAMVDATTKFMARFLAIELRENAASKERIVDVTQDMQGFDHSPQFGVIAESSLDRTLRPVAQTCCHSSGLGN